MTCDDPISLEPHSRGVVVPVRAAAGARRNAVLGVRQGALRIAVTAAPEKGKANQALIQVLSEWLGVAKSAVELLSGATAARKRFLITGAVRDNIEQKIAELAADS